MRVVQKVSYRRVTHAYAVRIRTMARLPMPVTCSLDRKSTLASFVRRLRDFIGVVEAVPHLPLYHIYYHFYCHYFGNTSSRSNTWPGDAHVNIAVCLLCISWKVTAPQDTHICYMYGTHT